ncbi:MAG TPA: sodium:solute symporter [Rugosimonospora sp.]|nr:sodium:solute symporter [Rugosimonospora sp.]
MFLLVTVMGFAAARWRRPETIHTLAEWGLGGRAFGNWVTFFLLSGDVYTAYTFVAVPALVYGVGAGGFFAVPFMVTMYPMLFRPLVRFWSVSHVHGFVTPAEFVRARFGSPVLSLLIAVTGIVATMPYIALQLVGIEAVFKVMGLPGDWSLTIAFLVLALFTFNSGLRAPALISIVKDALILWVVLAALVLVATQGSGWGGVFHLAGAKFAASPSTTDGLLLLPTQQLNYLTLAIGSGAALFLYPHMLTGVLAARNRATIRRNLAAMPLYTFVLGALALLGFVAISAGVKPIGKDTTTVIPMLMATEFPRWCAGLGYAAIGVGALVPAAIMSIAAANMFTRNIYRPYIRPDATEKQETRVSKYTSLLVKLGAVLVILLINAQFAIDLQLIGGVIILQTLPAVAIGLYTRWLHRGALITGLVAGLLSGVVMLYQVPQIGGPDGKTVLREHFGGSAWPLSHLGLDTRATAYVGVLALAVNLLVAIVGTLLLRQLRVPYGPDATRPHDYVADEGDRQLHRMTEILDGESVHHHQAEHQQHAGHQPVATHAARRPGH